MIDPELHRMIKSWQLPEEGPLQQRINRMIELALARGFFGTSSTLIVSGLQYHLGGEEDTEELARLASVAPDDRVLDVCCFLGGPQIQLVESFGCEAVGVDVSERRIVAASKIAELSGFDSCLHFFVADAAHLPFGDRQFTVLWSQCSLKHDETWLREFDRVLAPAGRLALTFAIRKNNPDEGSPKWELSDVVEHLHLLGYRVTHAEDISERDIEIGWKALDRRLLKEKERFKAALGEDWVHRAHREFIGEIAKMRRGQLGNGRIIARKETDS